MVGNLLRRYHHPDPTVFVGVVALVPPSHRNLLFQPHLLPCDTLPVTSTIKRVHDPCTQSMIPFVRITYDVGIHLNNFTLLIDGSLNRLTPHVAFFYKRILFLWMCVIASV